MFGWTKKRKHAIEITLTKHFGIKLSTTNADLIRDVIAIVNRANISIGAAAADNQPASVDKTEEGDKLTDPDFRQWEHRAVAEDAAHDASEAAYEAAESARIATEVADRLRKEEQAKEAADLPKSAPEPMVHDERESYTLGQTLGHSKAGEKLASLAASMREAAPAVEAVAPHVAAAASVAKSAQYAFNRNDSGPPSEVPYAMKSSKVEEDGTITFRVRVACPKCSRTTYRYRADTNTFVKCRDCGTPLEMEPAGRTTVFDGRIARKIPVADMDGNHFHASRIYDYKQ